MGHVFDPYHLCVLLQVLLRERIVLCQRLKESLDRRRLLRACADALGQHSAAMEADLAAMIALRASLQRAHSTS